VLVAVIKALSTLVNVYANYAVSKIARQAFTSVIRLGVVACCTSRVAVVCLQSTFIDVYACRCFTVRDLTIPAYTNLAARSWRVLAEAAV
jgi:hypothetical protein